MINMNLLEQLSEAYRTGRTDEILLNNQIRDINQKMGNIKEITVQEYNDLKLTLDMKQRKLTILCAYNRGIHDAREMVLNTI
jgi:hypothetical protein